jgi:hypothetical protein
LTNWRRAASFKPALQNYSIASSNASSDAVAKLVAESLMA